MSDFMSNSKPTLRIAAKNATMHQNAVAGAYFMNAVRSQKNTENDDHVFDDADALIALAQRSFTKAARTAVAENDRLGIPTHGSVGGKLVVRQPHKAATPSQF